MENVQTCIDSQVFLGITRMRKTVDQAVFWPGNEANAIDTIPYKYYALRNKQGYRDRTTTEQTNTVHLWQYSGNAERATCIASLLMLVPA